MIARNMVWVVAPAVPVAVEAGAGTFHEGWENPPLGIYTPADSPLPIDEAFIHGDEGTPMRSRTQRAILLANAQATPGRSIISRRCPRAKAPALFSGTPPYPLVQKSGSITLAENGHRLLNSG